MSYETIEARNYDLDLVIAESRGVTIDQVDELPLGMVELLREDIISKSPNQWGLNKMICPDCHGNGYTIRQRRVLRFFEHCETCNSQGELDYVKESKDEKTDEN